MSLIYLGEDYLSLCMKIEIKKMSYANSHYRIVRKQT